MSNKIVTDGDIGDKLEIVGNKLRVRALLKADVGLNNVDNTSDVNKPISSAAQTALDGKQNLSEKNQNDGYAGLDSSGKIQSSQLPAIAISDTFVVGSQSAMLALSVEIGDVAVRTDLNKTFILKGTDPAVLANWQELLTPTSAVTSVFGRQGAVTANNGDYTTALVTETTNKRYQTDIQQAYNDATSSIQSQLNAKVQSVAATAPLGSSGGVSPTISISQANSTTNGFLTATDWNTFNAKQNVLTNPITGTGTGATNYLPKFTGASSLGNSQIYDNGTNVGIGTTSPSAKLEVNGTAKATTFNLNSNGSITGNSFWGTTTIAGTGSYADWAVLNTLNSSIMFNPTGTLNTVFSGNVGIGTTSPNQKLDVNGLINSTNGISVGGSGVSVVWTGTQVAYDAITTKSSTTIYFIQ